MILTSLVVLLLGLAPPSHSSRLVPVAPDVRVEVIDWGGRGPALIFLAGFGHSAHVFDGFAPQFTDSFHVIGVTRRGFGASSRPHDGFDTRTLASDILAVMDSLHIGRARFAGHSFSGSELNYLGAYHPDRVTALAYIDASYDFPRLFADSTWLRAFPISRPAQPSTGEIEAWREWFALALGPALPDDEIRVLQTGGAAAEPFQTNAVRIDRRRIKVPVVALWAMPASVRDQYPYVKSLGATEQRRLERSFVAQQSVRERQLALFRADVPTARVEPIRAGRHHLFLSHPAQVAAALRSFFTDQGLR